MASRKRGLIESARTKSTEHENKSFQQQLDVHVRVECLRFQLDDEIQVTFQGSFVSDRRTEQAQPRNTARAQLIAMATDHFKHVFTCSRHSTSRLASAGARF